MMFDDVSVVVCDLDDTLYPEREYAISGLRAAAEAGRSIYGLMGLEEAFVSLFETGHRGNVFQQALRSVGMEAPDQAMIGHIGRSSTFTMTFMRFCQSYRVMVSSHC